MKPSVVSDPFPGRKQHTQTSAAFVHNKSLVRCRQHQHINLITSAAGHLRYICSLGKTLIKRTFSFLLSAKRQHLPLFLCPEQHCVLCASPEQDNGCFFSYNAETCFVLRGIQNLSERWKARLLCVSLRVFASDEKRNAIMLRIIPLYQIFPNMNLITSAAVNYEKKKISVSHNNSVLSVKIQVGVSVSHRD